MKNNIKLLAILAISTSLGFMTDAMHKEYMPKALMRTLTNKGKYSYQVVIDPKYTSDGKGYTHLLKSGEVLQVNIPLKIQNEKYRQAIINLNNTAFNPKQNLNFMIQLVVEEGGPKLPDNVRVLLNNNHRTIVMDDINIKDSPNDMLAVDVTILRDEIDDTSGKVRLETITAR